MSSLEILTDRLLLRPFEAGDDDLVYAVYSDPEVLKYTPFDVTDRPGAEERLREIIDGWRTVPQMEFEYAVILRETGEKIGRAHISREWSGSAMIGWLLLPQYWGKGYATEMTRPLIDYACDVLGEHRVYAVCNPANEASWRTLEGAGMRREAHFRRKCRYVKNRAVSWEDELEYAILADERPVAHN